MKRISNTRWNGEAQRLRNERAKAIDAPHKLRSDQEQLDVIATRPGSSAKEVARIMKRMAL
jgi:hypothetical protein